MPRPLTRHILALLLFISLCTTKATALALEVDPGQLHKLIDSPAGISELTLSGRIDASDLFFIADSLTQLRTLDIAGTSIEAYSGPLLRGSKSYPADEIPARTFAASALSKIIFPTRSATIICDGAFAASALTTVTLGDSITSIGAGCFSACPFLAEATIAVDSLPDGAFASCPALKSVTLTAPLVSISDNAFINCTSLESVIGCERINLIGSRAFSCCSSLGNFTFGNKLTYIGPEAFAGAGLTSIDLSQAVALGSVGRWAFAHMPALKSVDTGSLASLPEGMVFECPALMAFNTSAKELPDFALTGDTSLPSSITVGEGTSTIGRYALSGLSQLSEISLPSSLTAIGDNAMERLDALANINTTAAIPAQLGNDVWAEVDKPKVVLTVPDGSEQAYKSATQWQDFTIETPMGVNTPAADSAVTISARFVGHELHVQANGTDIARLHLYDPAGRLLASSDPASPVASFDTQHFTNTIFLLSASLADGSRASISIAKTSL